MAITINKIDPADKTALHCHYPNQTNQQPCELRIDLQNGILSVGYNPEIGHPRAMTMSAWCRRTIVFEIPCLTTVVANRLLDDAGPLAQRMIDNSEIEWDGNNRVGKLGIDAQAAQEELADLIATYQDADTLSTGNVLDWFCDGPEDALRWEELGFDSTDDDLYVAGERIASEALEQNTVIDPDDIVKYLRLAREDAREERRDELSQVAIDIDQMTEELDRVKARRDKLVTQQISWGDTCREIGERARLSHVAVQKIAKREEAKKD